MVQPFHQQWVPNQVIAMCHLSSDPLLWATWSSLVGKYGRLTGTLWTAIEPYLDNVVGHGHTLTTEYTSCKLHVKTICEARIGPLRSSYC